MSLQHYRQGLAPGTRLHWYEIERVLGQGGFGITYFARDTNLDQPVAIKEYLPVDIARRGDDGQVEARGAGDAELYQLGMARFLTEAKTLNRFDHRNIVRVYSMFEANNTAYMVMRYEEGEALNDVLERVKTLPQDKLLEIVRPLLDGLAQVHAAGYIHRDVQPANIYLRRDGSPVLLDFGAARESSSSARTMTILVAPGYAPIEQYYAHAEQQGPWTDIYGLGASLYRAIAGAPPIDAIERSRGMLGSTRDVLMPALVAGHGRYSDAFLAAVDHALMFNEKDRPQSATEWARELDGVASVTDHVRAESAVIAQDPTSPGATVADLSTVSATHTPASQAVRARRVLPMIAVTAALAASVAVWKTFETTTTRAVPAPRVPAANTSGVAHPPPVDSHAATTTSQSAAAAERIASLEAEVRELIRQRDVKEQPGPANVTPVTVAGTTSKPNPTTTTLSSSNKRNATAITTQEPVRADVAQRVEEGAASHAMTEATRNGAAASPASAAVAYPRAEASAASPQSGVHLESVAFSTDHDGRREASAADDHAAERRAASPAARARALLAASDYASARGLLLAAATNG